MQLLTILTPTNDSADPWLTCAGLVDAQTASAADVVLLGDADSAALLQGASHRRPRQPCDRRVA